MIIIKMSKIILVNDIPRNRVKLMASCMQSEYIIGSIGLYKDIIP